MKYCYNTKRVYNEYNCQHFGQYPITYMSHYGNVNVAPNCIENNRDIEIDIPLNEKAYNRRSDYLRYKEKHIAKSEKKENK